MHMPQSIDQKIIDWLLDSDPSIRWQVMRDLLDAKPKAWQAERARIAKGGWGRKFLDLQQSSGRWDGGIYGPKWTGTTYTLLLLRDMGLGEHRAAQRGCKLILKEGFAHISQGRQTTLAGAIAANDTCINGMWLALPAYFGIDDPKLADLVEHLLDQQMPDGGWNCRWRNKKGAVHSSFHTTFNVLDGIREAMSRRIGPQNKLREAEARAIEFMLVHRLFRSDKTGAVINEVFTKLSFPPRWHYDILRGLDYIRTTAAIGDPRLEDAFDLLLSKRRADGAWPVQQKHAGKVYFNMETMGKPSRWNTLRALRCLRARGIAA
jgi:hypothetical protein